MAEEEKKRHLFWRLLATIVSIALIAVLGLALVLTITEYHPAPNEVVTPQGEAAKTLAVGEEITVLSWNVGYGALGDNADFFMDGGTHVLTSTDERIRQNVNDIVAEIDSIDPAIAVLQEVDVDSKRSAFINQLTEIADSLPGRESFYATNYRTILVPFGIPFYGKIEGGLQTLSSFPSSSANRIAIPEAFTWPMSTVQLKRCVLVTRFPVEGSERELVVMNIHPDAYTDAEHHHIQATAIEQIIAEEARKGNWIIAGGDWNHTFSNIDTSAYPLLDENYWVAQTVETSDFAEGWQFLMDNSVPSCRLLNMPLEGSNPDEVQYYVIDGFVTSPNVKVESLETKDLGFRASDHNPVVLKVTLEEA